MDALTTTTFHDANLSGSLEFFTKQNRSVTAP